MATGVECYMKQHGVSESEAIAELYKKVENTWKDMNEEIIRPTVVSRDLLLRILNLSRQQDVMYKIGDGYTNPELFKDFVLALFVDPIPIWSSSLFLSTSSPHLGFSEQTLDETVTLRGRRKSFLISAFSVFVSFVPVIKISLWLSLPNLW